MCVLCDYTTRPIAAGHCFNRHQLDGDSGFVRKMPNRYMKTTIAALIISSHTAHTLWKYDNTIEWNTIWFFCIAFNIAQYSNRMCHFHRYRNLLTPIKYQFLVLIVCVCDMREWVQCLTHGISTQFSIKQISTHILTMTAFPKSIATTTSQPVSQSAKPHQIIHYSN